MRNRDRLFIISILLHPQVAPSRRHATTRATGNIQKCGLRLHNVLRVSRLRQNASRSTLKRLRTHFLSVTASFVQPDSDFVS